MDSDDPKRRQWLFDQATELPPERRASFLARECGSDMALRRRIEVLLHHDSAAGDAFLKKPLHRLASDLSTDAGSGVAAVAPAEPLTQRYLPERIGRYEVLGILGEGGMGTVYEARQDNPRRSVALKTVRPGHMSRGLHQRLQHEALILGHLHHHHIAQVYEAGVAAVNDGGRTADVGYIAMELVHGRPLTAYCAAKDLGVRSRLQLMGDVCNAVHHAHTHGVIHRDLKPGNILVTDEGDPKILDFGVARVTSDEVDAMTLLTEAGQLIGTMAYMSPEQVLGDSGQIDARSDIYSLGVVLFELLAGRLPYDVHGRPVPEAARVIREEEPSHLSSVNSIFRGDVETIVAKALEKERERRYQAAGELAADIRRYLRDEPIVARPASSFYQLCKFAKRNKSLVAGIAATFLALVAGLIGMAWFAAREAQQHRLADESNRRAFRNLEIAEHRAYRQSVHVAEAALERNDATAARWELDHAPEALRGWEWYHFQSRTDDSLTTFRTSTDLGDHAAHAAEVEFSADGRTVAVVTWSSEEMLSRWWLETFDLASDPPRRMRRVRIPGAPRVTIAGRYVIVQGPGQSWFSLDMQTTETKPIATDGEPARADGMLHDLFDVQPRLLKWTDSTLEIVEPGTGITRPLPYTPPKQSWRRDAYSTDGTLLAYPTGQLEETRVLVWDAARAELLHLFDGDFEEIHGLAFSPDNRRIAAAFADGTIRQWDLTTGERTNWPIPPKHEDRVCAITYSPDGRLIATGSRDRTVRLWNADTGIVLNTWVGHQREISSVAFSPDGSRLASVSMDGEIKIWDSIEMADSRTLSGHSLYVYAVALSPDGARLASASWDATVRIWDSKTSEPVATITMPSEKRSIIRSMAYHPRAQQIVVNEQTVQLPRESRLRVLDAATGVSQVVFASDRSGSRPGMAFYSDGSRLAVSGIVEDELIVFESNRYNPVARVPGGGPCAVRSTGKPLLAVATVDHRILTYDAQTLQAVRESSGHTGTIWSLAFSPDGRVLASGGEDNVVRLWDADTGDPLAVLEGHTDTIYALAFLPDGTRIASGSNDQSIRLWDTASWEEICHLHGHEEYVFSLVFSADGRTLFSGSGDYTVKTWELDPLRVRLNARHKRERMVAALRPRIEQLFKDYDDPETIVERINRDQSLPDREREVALQHVLAESVRRLERRNDGARSRVKR